MLHRMRAELVVKLEMGAFAEQMQIEIGQDRRKAIGVLQLDLAVAEARAQAVMIVARRNRAGEQAGVVDARQFADVARLVEHLDLGGFGQEHAHHRLVVLVVPAEIVERIVVMALDDGARGDESDAHDRAPRCGAAGCATFHREERAAMPAGSSVRIPFRKMPFRAGRNRAGRAPRPDRTATAPDRWPAGRRSRTPRSPSRARFPAWGRGCARSSGVRLIALSSAAVVE